MNMYNVKYNVRVKLLVLFFILFTLSSSVYAIEIVRDDIISFQNITYTGGTGDNVTWNETIARTIFNVTWTESLAKTLFSEIKWNYNQSLFIEEVYGKWFYNMSDGFGGISSLEANQTYPKHSTLTQNITAINNTANIQGLGFITSQEGNDTYRKTEDELSIYNSTYDGLIKWGYNQSTGTYEMYGIYWYNHTSDTYDLWNTKWSSTYNATYDAMGNMTWNETLARTLFAEVKWGYNMTVENESAAIYTYIDEQGFLTEEVDPVFDAWDKDYNDLINTPNLDNNYNHTADVYTLWGEWFYNMSDGTGGLTSEQANTTYLSLDKGNWNLGSNWLKYDNPTLDFNESKLATVYYNATQSQAVAGTIDEGIIDYTQHPDGDYDGFTLNFTEASGSPALDIRMNFTGVNKNFTNGVMRYKTSSLAGDYPIIQMWNYDDGMWEDYPAVSESLTYATITQPVFDSAEHLENDVAQMRIYKATNGNTNNHYFVDWVAIASGYGTPSGQETDPYSIHRDGNITLTDNWFAGNYYITALGFNSTNWDNVTQSLIDGEYLNKSFNESIVRDLTNTTWSESLARTIFNTTWTEAVAKTLFSDIIYGYNHTLDTYNLWNAQWSRTSNDTYDALVTDNSSWNESGAREIFNTTWTESIARTLFPSFAWTDNNIVKNRTESETTMNENIAKNRTEVELSTQANITDLNNSLSLYVKDNVTYQRLLVNGSNNDTYEIEQLYDKWFYNMSDETGTTPDGTINSTAWNRSGTDVFLANTGDNVGIGDSTPAYKLDVNGDIGNSAGDLKIQSDVQGDVILFEDTDVDNGVVGKALSINRKAAEGDDEIKLFTNEHRNSKLQLGASSCLIEGGADRSLLIRANDGSGDVKMDVGDLYVGMSYRGGNPSIYHSGTITAASTQKYVQFQVDDSSDMYTLSREDTSISGFDIDMPIILSDLSGSYGSGSAHVCVYDNGTLFTNEGACP